MRKVLFLLFICFFFCACKTKYITVEKEVPIEKIKTEYKTKIIHDSIYNKDSVIVYSKGDTVFKDKYVYSTKYRNINDTIYITDSIDRPVYITKEVEVNKLNKPQIILIYSGLFFFVFLFIYGLKKIIK